jgi:mono/diheme cytochrome c family protein
MPISGPDFRLCHEVGAKFRVLKLVCVALGSAFFIAPAATAQQGIGPVLSVQEQQLSIWDGIFTEAQATRGQAAYTGACALCHGIRLDGAPDDPDMRATPPLARARFLRVWEGRTLGTLLAFTRATMPEDNPNSLTGQEYVDVIAYMLSVGGMPVGNDELQTDPTGLARIVIGPRP